MPRKKNHLLAGPRRKRMTREERLQSAKSTRWIEQYEGKNIIRSYGKWFAVDPLCAITELRMLGVTVTEEREIQIRATVEARSAATKRRAEWAAGMELEESFADSDDTFAYIAGYTPGGVPYGVTWEEFGEDSLWEDDNEAGIDARAAAAVLMKE